MKKYFRFFLALVLALTLFTGSVGILAFAEDGNGEEGTDSTAPESTYSMTPVVFDCTDSDLQDTTNGEPINISTSDQKPVAVTLITDDGHIATMTIEKININSSSSVPGAEPVAVVVESTGTGSVSTVRLDGTISCDVQDAASPASAVGVRASSVDGGTANVIIEDSTVLQVGDSAQYCDDPRSVIAESQGTGSTTNVTIEGLAQDSIIAGSDEGGHTTVKHTNKEGIDGYVKADSDGEGSQTTVKVEGDVSGYVEINAAGNGEVDASFSGDVDQYVALDVRSGGEASVTVGGSVGEDVAVIASDAGDENQAEVTVNGQVGGQVVVILTDNASAAVSVEGEGVDGTQESLVNEGINADLRNGSQAVIDVNGMIEGGIVLNQEGFYDADGIGFKLDAEKVEGSVDLTAGKSGSVDIDINGDLTADQDGITVNNHGAEINVDISGDMTVRSVTTDEQPDLHATGINIVNYEGDIDINIDGNLDVSGSGQDTAIVIDRRACDAFVRDDSAEQVNVSTIGGESIGDYCIDDVIVPMFKAEQADGSVIYYDNEGRVYNVFGKVEKGTTKVRIGNDANSNGTGIEFTGKGDEQTDIIIDGTLNAQGGPAVVLKNEEAAIGDNLTLTVWKISPDKDGDFVKREVTDDQTNEKTRVSDRASEQAIQYIMKIHDDQTDVIATRGTTNFEGRTIAHEGDTVTLMINVPEGMAIDAVYGDKNSTKLYKNDEGQYFMVVPRGGGVYFSVTFCPRTPEEEVNPQPDPEIKPVPKPEPKPQLQPEPEPQPEPQPEPRPQTDVKPSENTGAIEEQPRIVVVAPLMTIMDITNKMQLNFYPNKTFTAHIRDGRTVSGKFMLIDDILTLVTSDNIRVPIAPDGTMNFIYGDECFSFIFNIDDLAKIRSLVM